MSEVITRSIRVTRDDWRDFRQLQIELERQRRGGQLSQAETFKICIASTSALLRGEVHVTPGAPQQVVTPVSMVWRDEPKEPNG